VLLAYPEATIYLFGDGPPQPLEYRDTEHYQVTRAFLENPERMLRELMKEESDS
jgi:predicted ATPase